MRILFAILLVANLVLAALGVLAWRQQTATDPQSPGAAADDGGIRIVKGEPEPAPPPPAEAPGREPAEGSADAAREAPADAAEPSDGVPVPGSGAEDGARSASDSACIEIAPLSQEELGRIRGALAALGLEDRTTVESVPATASWWVFIPPRASREQAEKEVLRLNAAGVRETYVVQDQSDMRHAISLGIFRTRDSADRFAEGVRAKGVRGVTVDARPLQIRLSAVFVRDPDPAQTRRLLELKALFPGADVRATACPG